MEATANEKGQARIGDITYIEKTTCHTHTTGVRLRETLNVNSRNLAKGSGLSFALGIWGAKGTAIIPPSLRNTSEYGFKENVFKSSMPLLDPITHANTFLPLTSLQI